MIKCDDNKRSTTPLPSSNPVVISLGDSLLRESDVRLLEPPNWLNDRLIGFYFQYLHSNHFQDGRVISFISPEVSQFLKLSESSSEMTLFFDPLELQTKEVIVIAVNNQGDPGEPGGTHWSLLLYSKQSHSFYHFDSIKGLNHSDAIDIAQKLYSYLKFKHIQSSSSTSDHLSFPSFQFNEVPCLSQVNSYDCGIHVLCNAEAYVRHFCVFGSPEGLSSISISTVKKKREEYSKRIKK